MITMYECAYGEDGQEMYKVLDDEEIMMSKIYSKLFPELYAEIEAQYNNCKNHFYYLSKKAHLQYLQKKFGLIG